MTEALLPRTALGVAEEATVVALAMTGDDAAFGELVRRRRRLRRELWRRLCRDPALADDLSQAAFLQAWRSLPALKAPGAFGGWLRKLAVNLWLQHIRRHGREVPPLDAGETVETFGYEATVGEKLDLDRALELLPGDMRLCIVLAYVERMSHSEINDVTGIPLGTVKSHIARGSGRLREILNAYGSTA